MIFQFMTSSTTKDPLISIIVASYNYENLIIKTLDSLLAQTYKNYEVIVVDDGSKDKSVEVITTYTQKYDNVYLYTHENNVNKGLATTLQLGISKAKGEFVAFCESDDYWHPQHLEKKVEVINNQPNIQIISNNLELFGDQATIDSYNSYFAQLKEYLKPGWNHLDITQTINYIPTFSTVMIRTEQLKELNYDSTIPAWLDMWLYTQILKDNDLYYIPENLTFWRMHKSSYNNNNNVKKYKLYGPLFFKSIKGLLNQENDQTNDIYFQVQLLKKSPFFDREYYIREYKDSIHGIMPEAHYVYYGWRQGKNPSSSFSTKAYLANNHLNVKLSKIAPLVFHELFGNDFFVPIASTILEDKDLITDADFQYVTNKMGDGKSVLLIHDQLEDSEATRSLVHFASYLKNEEHFPYILALSGGTAEKEIKETGIQWMIDPAFAYHAQQSKGKYTTFLKNFNVVVFNTLNTSHLIKIYPECDSTKLLWCHDGNYNDKKFQKDINTIGNLHLFDKVYCSGKQSFSFIKQYTDVIDMTVYSDELYRKMVNSPKVISKTKFKKLLNRRKCIEKKMEKKAEYRKIKDLTLKDYHYIKSLIKDDYVQLEPIIKLILQLCKDNKNSKCYKLLYKTLWYRLVTKKIKKRK